jgi:MFS superfamily sulfate permease-like transporter
LSQSAVNEKGGARTPLAVALAAAVIALVLLFFTGLFQSLPEAVLAAIVFVAVKGLIDLKELRYLWHASRIDFGAAGVALAGVLVMGILDGVIIAVLASLVMILGRAARPHVAFLGRIPGTTDRFSDVARHPENEAIPGVLAFRVEASLVYFNVDHVLGIVLRRAESEPGLRRVVYDLSSTPYVDVAGARMLRRLHDELAGKQSDCCEHEAETLVSTQVVTISEETHRPRHRKCGGQDGHGRFCDTVDRKKRASASAVPNSAAGSTARRPADEMTLSVPRVRVLSRLVMTYPRETTASEVRS